MIIYILRHTDKFVCMVSTFTPVWERICEFSVIMHTKLQQWYHLLARNQLHCKIINTVSLSHLEMQKMRYYGCHIFSFVHRLSWWCRHRAQTKYCNQWYENAKNRACTAVIKKDRKLPHSQDEKIVFTFSHFANGVVAFFNVYSFFAFTVYSRVISHI